MPTITDEDLAMFKERSKTELRSNYDVTRLAWDDVVPALCNEVAALRKSNAAKEKMLLNCTAFLSKTIQCGVEGEVDGQHVNVAASNLADEIHELLDK